LVQIRVLLFILLIGIIFSTGVVLIARFEKKSRLPKYIPFILLFAAGMAFFAKARWFSDGMEGLGYIVLAMLVFGGGILTAITAIAIDLSKRYKNRRKTE